MIRGFEALGWEVRRYIAGDHQTLASSVGEEKLVGAWPKRAALDLGRLAYGSLNRRRALRAVGTRVDWVYERFASFQALGEPFRRSGIPWILETQGPTWLEARRDRRSLALARLARRLEVAAYRTCDVVVCVTDALKEILISTAGVREKKILVVPNGVDLEYFDPAHIEAVRTFKEPTLVFAGALIHWQRLDVLIDALGAFKEGREGTPPFKLVLMGDGAERESLEARIRNQGLSEHVQILGRVSMDEVPRRMLGAELGFVGHVGHGGGEPYHSPLKLYEYMAMGLPVLAGRTPETESLIREGETGFLFESGHREDLFRALSSAFRRLEELDSLGQRARTTAEANGWPRRVETIIAGVRRILASRNE